MKWVKSSKIRVWVESQGEYRKVEGGNREKPAGNTDITGEGPLGDDVTRGCHG